MIIDTDFPGHNATVVLSQLVAWGQRQIENSQVMCLGIAQHLLLAAHPL